MSIMCKPQLNCPRCDGSNLIDYGDSIDCVDCNLEFEKGDLTSILDETSILSLQEKYVVASIVTSY